MRTQTNSENHETNAVVDKFKWVLVLLLVVFVIWGNFYFSEPNRLYQANSLVRIIAVVVLSLLALFLALTTLKGRSFLTFAKESRMELRKVVWPTRKEAVQTTLLIAVICMVVALFLWGLDSIIIKLVSLITSIGH